MKPSEMSNEELADAIEFEVAERPIAIAHLVSDDYYLEAAARLRNSIPKPVVEDHVRDYGGEYVTINGHEVCSFGLEEWWNDAYEIAESIKTALGINDTEGGE